MDKLFFGELEKQRKGNEAKYMAARGKHVVVTGQKLDPAEDLREYNTNVSEEE